MSTTLVSGALTDGIIRQRVWNAFGCLAGEEHMPPSRITLAGRATDGTTVLYVQHESLSGWYSADDVRMARLCWLAVTLAERALS